MASLLYLYYLYDHNTFVSRQLLSSCQRADTTDRWPRIERSTRVKDAITLIINKTAVNNKITLYQLKRLTELLADKLFHGLWMILLFTVLQSAHKCVAYCSDESDRHT